MREDIKSKLDSALDKHEAARLAANQAKQAAESKEQVFLQNFMRLREEMIRPAMEEIGGHLKDRGWDYRVVTENDKPSQDGRSESTSASIAIYFYRDGRGSPTNDYPNLKIICNKSGQKVWFHRSTMQPGRGGQAGSVGETSLELLDHDLVQEKILGVVTEMLR